MADPFMYNAKRFIGRAYVEASADENGSYQSVWDDALAGDVFAKIDAVATTPNRASLSVFSPYGSAIYWIGSVVEATTPVPEGMQFFDLPAATVGQATKNASMMLTMLPAESILAQGALAIDKAGYPIPEFIGQTQTPYFVERYNLDDGAVTSVTYTVYVGDDVDYGYDDVD